MYYKIHKHAWKACKRQKRFGGSNPPHSAHKTLKINSKYIGFQGLLYICS